MNPRDPKNPNPDDIDPDEGPDLEQQDWDAVVTGDLSPDSMPENGDEASDLPDEDDDNAFQHSDEVLPDDEEEAELRRHPTHERSRFGE